MLANANQLDCRSTLAMISILGSRISSRMTYINVIANILCEIIMHMTQFNIRAYNYYCYEMFTTSLVAAVHKVKGHYKRK